MTKLLLAKPVIEEKISKLNKKCLQLTERGLRPKMQVVLVGENPASLLYVRNKKRLCERVGADFVLIELSAEVSKDDFLATINEMNNDPSVTGCFVQLPIPKHLQDIDVTELIAAEKDVDGFGIESIVDIYKNDGDGYIPCTPKGILTLCDYYDINLEGKHAVVIGRSLIVGKPMSLLLTNKNATVTLCHSRTKDLAYFTKQADVIVSAIGNARFLKADYFRDDKSQVVIDVGITKDDNNKTCGDVDFENVKDNVAAITPVPGGVGPLTVLSLIENLTIATERILNKK
jgi:methylenetetrahydrofolate dehydrogenase (NADP+)/methenyltetrahydrofolate cyclohydrolase